MKKILLSFYLLLIAMVAMCQNKADSIQIARGSGEFYKQHGKILTLKELWDVIEKDSSTHDELKKAKTNYYTAMIFGYSGGFCVGFSLGSLLAGGQVNIPLLVVGGVCITVCIPTNSSFIDHTRRAAEIYNRDLK